MHIEIRGAEKLSFREKQAVVLKETGLGNEETAKRFVNFTVAILSRARQGYEESDPHRPLNIQQK